MSASPENTRVTHKLIYDVRNALSEHAYCVTTKDALDAEFSKALKMVESGMEVFTAFTNNMAVTNNITDVDTFIKEMLEQVTKSTLPPEVQGILKQLAKGFISDLLRACDEPDRRDAFKRMVSSSIQLWSCLVLHSHEMSCNEYF